MTIDTEPQVPADTTPPGTVPAAGEVPPAAGVAPPAGGPPPPVVPPVVPAPPPPEPGDDAPPDPNIEAIALDAATGDARKPLADPTKDLWSPEPDKKKAREAIEAAYKAATGATPEGALAQLYRVANEEFIEAARHLTRAEADGSTPLQAWLDKYAKPGTDFWAFLKQLPNLEARVLSRKGWRERDRDAARDTTAAWAEAHRLWSDPVASITALLTGLREKIQTAHGEFGEAYVGDIAIYRLWFEYAPIILRLNAVAPTESAFPGYAAVNLKLAGFPNLLKRLTSGSTRNDGSLYLIPWAQLTAHRRWVLGEWRKSADVLAKAEAAFTQRPDDLASLAPKLKDRLDREPELAATSFPAAPTP